MSDTNGGEFKMEFVTDQYFLDRVKQFEGKYGISWLQFCGQYKDGTFDCETSETQMEFTEWAFICETFWDQLIKSDLSGPRPDAR